MVRTKITQIYQNTAGRIIHLLSRDTSEPFTYVALGDSTVEGIGASAPTRNYAHTVYANIKLRFKGAVYYNFGKNGARVKDVLDTQLDKAVAAQPDLVTISIGANDVVHHTSLKTFRRRLNALLDRLQQETQAVIVISNVPNFSILKAVPWLLKPVARFHITRFNAVILEAATAHEVLHIDTYKQSTVFAKQFPEAVFSDNFHPSDFGYALWANTILTAIEHKLPLLKRATEHSKKI